MKAFELLFAYYSQSLFHSDPPIVSNEGRHPVAIIITLSSGLFFCLLLFLLVNIFLALQT